MAVEQEALTVVAVILGAHGVRGDVRVKSFTDNPVDAFAYGPLTNETGAALVTPKSWREAKSYFIVSPEEFRQKEDWDELKGTLLHVPRAALPDLATDETYVDDLVGCAVFGPDGARLGDVKAVHNFGAGDLLEINPGTRAKTVLVPLTEEDVPVIGHHCGTGDRGDI